MIRTGNWRSRFANAAEFCCDTGRCVTFPGSSSASMPNRGARRLLLDHEGAFPHGVRIEVETEEADVRRHCPREDGIGLLGRVRAGLGGVDDRVRVAAQQLAPQQHHEALVAPGVAERPVSPVVERTDVRWPAGCDCGVPELLEVRRDLGCWVLPPEQLPAELGVEPDEVGLHERGVGHQRHDRVRRDRVEAWQHEVLAELGQRRRHRLRERRCDLDGVEHLLVAAAEALEVDQRQDVGVEGRSGLGKRQHLVEDDVHQDDLSGRARWARLVGVEPGQVGGRHGAELPGRGTVPERHADGDVTRVCNVADVDVGQVRVVGPVRWWWWWRPIWTEWGCRAVEVDRRRVHTSEDRRGDVERRSDVEGRDDRLARPHEGHHGEPRTRWCVGHGRRVRLGPRYVRAGRMHRQGDGLDRDWTRAGRRRPAPGQ